MALSKSFASCKFAPATADKTGNSTCITLTPIGSWKTTSFFIDSSGRSTFDLPIFLTFNSQEDLNEFLASKCLDPAPKNLVESDETDANDTPAPETESSLGFEVKSYSVDEKKSVVVESVVVRECAVEELAVRFDLEVTVRASNHQYEPSNDDSSMVNPNDLSVVTNLEIVPVLTIRDKPNEKDASSVPDSMALELAATPDHMHKAKKARVTETRLTAMALNLTLTHAFTISVKSVDGPSIGNTLISLTIRHSNSHPETVTISNISMHPGHSRYKTVSEKNRSMPGAQYSVTNMTKAVQWGYVPKTQLDLPLTLNTNDAYSTILTVNASEEMHSRSFISPVSVTGAVGSTSINSDSALDQKQVVVAADAHWSTGLIAVEPTDAFRIDMDIKDSDVILGEPMIVYLKIFNLSLESCDLMLLMAKEEGGEDESTSKHRAVNTAVISEVDGYKFGVWGISGEDDGTVRLIRDNGLLAMDAALMLGKVQGQHAIEAELRFVPLRDGRLQVPNWKLYDRSAGSWYTCYHNLTMVARTKA